MKLFVKEKLISMHNRYFMYDESGNEVFELESKVISIGNKTSLKDMSGNVLVYVEQEVFHLMPRYKIFIQDNLVGTVVKKFVLFKNNYEVPELGMKVEGDFLSSEFKVYDGSSNEVAIISRKLLSIGDKYNIEIMDEKNYLNILGVLVAIINVVDDNQSDASITVSNN